MGIAIRTTPAGRIESSAEQMDLHTAAERGATRAIMHLIGSLPTELRQEHLKSGKGACRDTPLHCAAANGHAKAVALLVKLGADPNIKTIGSFTPLHEAASHCHVHVIRLLLSLGADPNIQRDSCKNTPLHWVVVPFHRKPATQIISSIQALVTSGALLNTKNFFGRMPLSDTLVRPHCDSTVILELIRWGAHVFTEDYNGNTPFHFAVSTQSPAVLVALSTAPVPADPRPYLKNKRGETPVDAARLTLLRIRRGELRGDRYPFVPAALEYMRSTQGAERHYGLRQPHSTCAIMG
jgi:ankyrin repeat protein